MTVSSTGFTGSEIQQVRFSSRAPLVQYPHLSMGGTSPEPGWYRDPSDPSRQRYWDGAAWTEHTGPAAVPPPWAISAPDRNTAAVGSLGVASLWTRAAAYVIDLVILWSVDVIVSILASLGALGIVAGSCEHDRAGLFVVRTCGTNWVYLPIVLGAIGIIYAWYRLGPRRITQHGATIGMRQMGIELVDAMTGRMVGAGRSLLRAVLSGVVLTATIIVLWTLWVAATAPRFAAGHTASPIDHLSRTSAVPMIIILPLLAMLPAVLAMFDGRGQALHDKATVTLVRIERPANWRAVASFAAFMAGELALLWEPLTNWVLGLATFTSSVNATPFSQIYSNNATLGWVAVVCFVVAITTGLFSPDTHRLRSAGQGLRGTSMALSAVAVVVVVLALVSGHTGATPAADPTRRVPASDGRPTSSPPAVTTTTIPPGPNFSRAEFDAVTVGMTDVQVRKMLHGVCGPTGTSRVGTGPEFPFFTCYQYAPPATAATDGYTPHEADFTFSTDLHLLSKEDVGVR